MTSPGHDFRRRMGAFIRGKRKQANLTIAQAAKALKVSESHIKRIECGYDRIALVRLFDFAEVYKVRIDDILERLQAYEPKVYANFISLEKRFAKRFYYDAFERLERRQKQSQPPSLKAHKI